MSFGSLDQIASVSFSAVLDTPSLRLRRFDAVVRLVTAHKFSRSSVTLNTVQHFYTQHFYTTCKSLRCDKVKQFTCEAILTPPSAMWSSTERDRCRGQADCSAVVFVGSGSLWPVAKQEITRPLYSFDRQLVLQMETARLVSLNARLDGLLRRGTRNALHRRRPVNGCSREHACYILLGPQ